MQPAAFVGQPSSESIGGAPTINFRNVAQEVPSSRSRLTCLEVPAALSGLLTRGATPYVKSSIPVKVGGSSSSNDTDQENVP